MDLYIAMYNQFLLLIYLCCEKCSNTLSPSTRPTFPSRPFFMSLLHLEDVGGD